jgi:hypothetical protein
VEAEPLTPPRVAERVCELAPDARAAVLLDASGALAGSSEEDPERSSALAELTGELLEAVDAAAPAAPPAQVEALVERGAVYVVRTPEWTLAAVARRSALSSLMFYDLRAVLAELEADAA